MRLEYQGNKEMFLYHMFNDLGHENLCLSHNYLQEDGEQGFSKWIPYKKIMELSQDDLIPGTDHSRKTFIQAATHRTILPIELVLDIDDSLLNNETVFSNVKEKAIWAIKKIKERGGDPIVYKSNRGYHIHLLVPSLTLLHHETIKALKLTFINEFGSDFLKAGSRNMIAMEGSPHWRSGLIKTEVII